MNLPRFALTHKPIVIGLAFVLFVWGLQTFLTAPRREDPEFTIREGLVITDWPGATAHQVEELITDKIEKTAANIKDVRRVQSWSFAGRSIVQVTGVDEVEDIRALWTKLRADLRLVEASLPEGAYPPVVDDNFGDTSALILALYQDPETALTNPYSPDQLADFAKRLRDNLMDLRPSKIDASGKKVPLTTEPSYIAKLNLYGVQEEAIYLEADAGLWSQLALTTDQLQMLLDQRNAISSAGTFNSDRYRINTTVPNHLDTLEEINRMVVERVQTGAETPGRETLAEFSNRIAAGMGSDTDTGAASYSVPVHLSDVDINVVHGYTDPAASLVRYADAEIDSPAIVLSFTMKPGQNITFLGDAVDDLLETANQTFLPPDLIIEKVSNPPLFVANKVADVLSNLQSAIILVLLILGLLAGPRVAIVTALSIPIIMLSAVALMRIWNIEIEQISLAALIVALGLLVDNAIVTSENTTRFLNRGMSRDEAAIEGSNLVGSSLLWSSLTTIGVFIPMAFVLPGDLGEYIFSLPVVVTLTLLVSWLCAMTLTPILSSYLLRPSGDALPIVRAWLWVTGRLGVKRTVSKRKQSADAKGFVKVMRFALRFRFATVGVVFACLAASLMLPVKPSFFPNSDRNQFPIDIYLPTDASLYHTDDVARQVELITQRLSDTTWKNGRWQPLVNDQGERINRLQNLVSYVGTGGPRFYTGLNPGQDKSNYAFIMVNATNRDHVNQYIKDIRRAAWSGIGSPAVEGYIAPIAGARVVPHNLVMGTPVSSPIQYRLTGPRLANENALRQYAGEIKDVLADSGLVWDVHDSWEEYGLQMDVEIDSNRANMAGITSAGVAHSLHTYYSGLKLIDYRDGDKQIPVLLRLPAEQRNELSRLESSFVEGFDQKVPLQSIANLSLKREPVAFTRYQRERSIWIEARPEDGLNARDILATLQPRIDAISSKLPAGYRIEDGGIEEEAQRGERANSLALGVGIVLVIFCLIFQYNSAIKPLLVLLTVPLSVIGGMLGLWLRGIPLGFMETLGFLALFGTVLNAAILLIDFTEQLIKEKLDSGEGAPTPGERHYCGLTREAFRNCIVDAAAARAMPIFMTTATTVAGLMSLMFGGGPLFMGLATVFAVGLLFGSAITLIVLPALIAILVEVFHYSLVPVDEESILETATGNQV